MQIRIEAKEMQDVLYAIFKRHDFSDHDAHALAKVHTESTLHGVNSHGINRIPLFIEYIKKRVVNVGAQAERVESLGSIERWDGKFGSGVLNALKCTDRAVELAKENGMGLVALKNTNHWMRAGSYGWQAADQGCISILFTNTQPNMPPWGGQESRLGNNPLVVSIPRENGHIVLDMAMSQFSFGKIHEYKLKGEKLPYPGGWDNENNLSTDPEKILPKERGLPVGYWKGSALSMVLDMLATLLSAGNSTGRVGENSLETGLSQVFLSIYPEIFQDQELQNRFINEIIEYSKNITPIKTGEQVYYPGERSIKAKLDNQKNGMIVSKEVWNKVLKLQN